MAHGRGQETQGTVSGGEAPEELKGPNGAKFKGSSRVCSHDNSTWGCKEKNWADKLSGFVLKVT